MRAASEGPLGSSSSSGSSRLWGPPVNVAGGEAAAQVRLRPKRATMLPGHRGFQKFVVPFPTQVLALLPKLRFGYIWAICFLANIVRVLSIPSSH